jgi:hypothetical protein
MCRRSSGRSGTMSVCDILLSNDEGRESRMENDGINKSKDDRILNGVCVCGTFLPFILLNVPAIHICLVYPPLASLDLL